MGGLKLSSRDLAYKIGYEHDWLCRKIKWLTESVSYLTVFGDILETEQIESNGKISKYILSQTAITELARYFDGKYRQRLLAMNEQIETKTWITVTDIAKAIGKTADYVTQKAKRMIRANARLVENQHIEEYEYEKPMPLGGTRKYHSYRMDEEGFNAFLLTFTGDVGQKLALAFSSTFKQTVAAKRQDELTIEFLNERINKAAVMIKEFKKKITELECHISAIESKVVSVTDPRKNTLKQLYTSLNIRTPYIEIRKWLIEKKHISNKGFPYNNDYFEIVTDRYGEYAHLTPKGWAVFSDIIIGQFARYDKKVLKEDERIKEGARWMTTEQLAKWLNTDTESMKEWLYNKGYSKNRKCTRPTVASTNNNWGKIYIDEIIWSPSFQTKVEFEFSK